jgi:hypothetical protein
MPITIEEVRAVLSPAKVNYQKVADQLGTAALPWLEAIIEGTDKLLAAKAVYLAGLIGGARSVGTIMKGANSTQPTVRIAAAAAAARLTVEHRTPLFERLESDGDPGVMRVTAKLNKGPKKPKK